MLSDELMYVGKMMPGCPLVTVLVGFPASGKSTWAKAYNYSNGDVILSSDAIRGEIFGSEEEQGNPKLVFDTLKERLIENLKKGNDVVIDATSINRWERADYISIAREYNAIPLAIIFDTPIDECKRRNSIRERKVPDFVYDKMAEKYEEPSTDEGFSAVILYSDEK